MLEAGSLAVGDGTGEGLTATSAGGYVVVHPLIQDRDGSLCAPFSDVDKWMVATSWGVSREQAEWLADRVESLLDASALTVTEIVRSEAARDDATASPSLWMIPVRARLRAYAST